MEIIGLSPQLLTGLALAVMVLMQVLKYAGWVVDEDSSTAAQRIVVAVLSGAAVLVLNWTQFLALDFTNPIGALTNFGALATALFVGATAAYHLLWDTISGFGVKLVSLFKK